MKGIIFKGFARVNSIYRHRLADVLDQHLAQVLFVLTFFNWHGLDLCIAKALKLSLDDYLAKVAELVSVSQPNDGTIMRAVEIAYTRGENLIDGDALVPDRRFKRVSILRLRRPREQTADPIIIELDGANLFSG